MYLKHLEELDEDRRRQMCATMFDTMFVIAEQLHGLDDNHRVTIKEIDDDDPSPDWYGRLVCLKWLAEYIKAIEFIPIAIGVQDEDGYSVSVINRYIFEDVMRELGQMNAKLTNYEGYDKSIDDRKTPNLVYYDTTTGKGLVNGNPINLEGRNKRLFNELFKAAPKSLSRTALLKVARTGRYKEDGDMYVVSNAFNLLRKACKVKSEVMPISDGTAKLNAIVLPLSAQFPLHAISPPK